MLIYLFSGVAKLNKNLIHLTAVRQGLQEGLEKGLQKDAPVIIPGESISFQFSAAKGQAISFAWYSWI